LRRRALLHPHRGEWRRASLRPARRQPDAEEHHCRRVRGGAPPRPAARLLELLHGVPGRTESRVRAAAGGSARSAAARMNATAMSAARAPLHTVRSGLDRPRELEQLRPWRVVFDVARCYALIALAFALLAWSDAWWAYALAFVVIGTQQYAL